MESKKHYFSDPEEGQNAFDQLAKRFYEKNFGQMSKSDIEVLMFSIYIEHVWAAKESDSDYALAVKLGIPESKVRRLKVEKDLKYPFDGFMWKEGFLECVGHASYDETDKMVKVNIPNPNMRRRVEAKIEEIHCYSVPTYNSKLLQMRADHFISLCVELSEELGGSFDENKVIGDLKKTIGDNSIVEMGELEQILRGGLKDVTQETLACLTKEVLASILNEIPFGKVAQPFVNRFIDQLRK